MSGDRRTARQRMVAGDWYNFRDPELAALRERALEAVHQHNILPPAQRGPMAPALAAILGTVGEGARIEQPFHCSYGVNIHLGTGAYLNFGCVLLDHGRVDIGRDAMLGPGVHVYTVEHDRDEQRRTQGMEIARPVRIGDRAWIGGRAVILAGVTVGEGAVVAAGSVVTRDVPAGATVAGNPARVPVPKDI